MTTIPELYGNLYRHYGPQHWWPCRSGRRWEIVAGAVLTQNCAWRNVEEALAQLEQTALDTPESVLAAPPETVEEAVRPAGFYRQKTRTLRTLAEFFRRYEAEFAASRDSWALRKRLLAVRGVGPETADSILLYAFGQPLFVIDAYTRRVAERHLGLDGRLSYEKLQRLFMAALPPEVALYQEYHALLVQWCKDSCRKAGCGAMCRELC